MLPSGNLPDQVDIFSDYDQGSEDWHAVRRGIPTASKFSVIMASGQDGEDSATRTKLLYTMAGEILTGETAETFHNEAMQRGIDQEPEARAYYGRSTFATMSRVAFIKRTIHNLVGKPIVVGCSPDALVDSDGGLEVKITRADLLIPILKRGAAGLPSRHRSQCQGNMWVSGRKWWDLLIWCRGMPTAAKFRLFRDDIAIQKIQNAVETFVYDLDNLVTEIRAMGAR